MYLMAATILSLATASLESGIGKCPRLSGVKGFDVSKFLGGWFEVERSFYLIEMAASCTRLNVTAGRGSAMNVRATTINRWTAEGVESFGTAFPLLSDDAAVFRYRVNTKLPYSVARFLPGAGIYRILDTDYNNYAVLWSCSDFFLAYTDRMWILGRETHIREKTRIEIFERLKDFDLDPERLMISKNENCDFE